MFRKPSSDELERGLTFAEVFEKEVDKIEAARVRREVPPKADQPPKGEEHEWLKNDLVGLAFSGGGIRSATFNLGILQGLAKLGLLKYVDYLSTVSGGGYIGCWLAAWIKRKGLAAVEQLPMIRAVEPPFNRGLRSLL